MTSTAASTTSLRLGEAPRRAVRKVQAAGPGSCLTQRLALLSRRRVADDSGDAVCRGGGRRKAVRRQSQAGAASPGETQLERREDETLFVVGEVLPSSTPRDFSPPFPLPSLQSPSAGKTSQVRTGRLDFCKVTAAGDLSSLQRGSPDPPNQPSL